MSQQFEFEELLLFWADFVSSLYVGKKILFVVSEKHNFIFIFLSVFFYIIFGQL